MCMGDEWRIGICHAIYGPLTYLLVDWFMAEWLVFVPSNERVPLWFDCLKLLFIFAFLIAWTCVHLWIFFDKLCIVDRYCGVKSTQDYANIPHKCSRHSREGRTVTPSSTETPSEHQQSRQRRFSTESINRSTAELAQASAMDASFLYRLHINTPTPENVGNSSGPENISGKFLKFCLFLLYLNLCEV